LLSNGSSTSDRTADDDPAPTCRTTQPRREPPRCARCPPTRVARSTRPGPPPLSTASSPPARSGTPDHPTAPIGAQVRSPRAAKRLVNVLRPPDQPVIGSQVGTGGPHVGRRLHALLIAVKASPAHSALPRRVDTRRELANFRVPTSPHHRADAVRPAQAPASRRQALLSNHIRNLAAARVLFTALRRPVAHEGGTSQAKNGDDVPTALKPAPCTRDAPLCRE
jgi:hypothetical protein